MAAFHPCSINLDFDIFILDLALFTRELCFTYSKREHCNMQNLKTNFKNLPLYREPHHYVLVTSIF